GRGGEASAGGAARRQQRRPRAADPRRRGAAARRAGGHDGRGGPAGRRARRGRCMMAIWLTENSKIIVQGMTGSEGSKHTRRMLKAGAKVVGGVNARKAGQTVDFDGTVLPVYGTVAE